MKNKILLFLIIALLCKPAFCQEKTGFAIDLNAKNIAGLFTMTDENGRLKNLELMESVFKDGSLGFSLEKHHNVSSEFIYRSIENMTSRVDENGTLLLYFNSHGGGSGSRFAMMASGGSFKFSKALESIAKVKKVRRLIFLIDTCHAAGGIQEGLKEEGQLLRNIQSATPTSFLPEIPDRFSFVTRPFTGIFSPKGDRIDFGEDSGAYEEILIISSSSVEDLSTRGVFAYRLASTFNSIKKEKDITVGEFLKKFADSHSKSGQQPYYKILPDNSMFGEYLFGPLPAQAIPIKDMMGKQKEFDPNYIPVPKIK